MTSSRARFAFPLVLGLLVGALAAGLGVASYAGHGFGAPRPAVAPQRGGGVSEPIRPEPAGTSVPAPDEESRPAPPRFSLEADRPVPASAPAERPKVEEAAPRAPTEPERALRGRIEVELGNERQLDVAFVTCADGPCRARVEGKSSQDVAAAARKIAASLGPGFTFEVNPRATAFNGTIYQADFFATAPLRQP